MRNHDGRSTTGGRGAAAPGRKVIARNSTPTIDRHLWDVVEHKGFWIGQLSLVSGTLPFQVDDRWVAVMASSFPWELAVDAFLDFMDRLRSGRLPAGVDSPGELMDICVSAARRQR